MVSAHNDPPSDPSESLTSAQVHQELREKVRIGLDEARRGELEDADVVFRDLRRELDELERKRGPE